MIINHQEEETPPSNKKFWIAAGSVGAVLALGAASFALAGGSNNSEPSGQSTSTSSSPAQSGNTPTVKSVSAAVEGKNITFSIDVAEFDSSKWMLEYQITDNNRKVREEGTSRTSSFEVSTSVTSSPAYRVKARLVNDTSATEWSDSFTVKMEDFSGITTLEPSPQFYETAWAKGTGNTLQDAQESIETAWNIDDVTEQEAFERCLPANSGQMEPTLLLPPVPSTIPNGMSLRYLVTGWDGNSVSLTYVWCQ